MKSNNNNNKDYLRHCAYQNRSNGDLLSLWAETNNRPLQSVRTLDRRTETLAFPSLVGMWRAGGGEGDLCYSSKVHARVKLGPVGRSHATVMIGESEGKGAGYRGEENLRR